MSALAERLRGVVGRLRTVPLRELTDELSAIADAVEKLEAVASPVRPGPEGKPDDG